MIRPEREMFIGTPRKPFVGLDGKESFLVNSTMSAYLRMWLWIVLGQTFNSAAASRIFSLATFGFIGIPFLCGIPYLE